MKKELEGDQVPTLSGTTVWSCQTIQNILTNEKYMGDALLQKTYVTDCIKKTVKKNNGERPMYYVENHHEAIIPREVFPRRSSKRKVLQKTAKTEQGKYSGKYAFSELLVCGECGSPYKRVTWARNGNRRIVWRCVSRLEYGKKFCHYSPTMEEGQLQNAVMQALNQYAASRSEIRNGVLEAASLSVGDDGSQGLSLLDLRQRLETLDAEQVLLLEKVLDDMDNPDLNAQLKDLSAEKQALTERIEAMEQDEGRKSVQEAKRKELRQWLEKQPMEFTEYDDTLTRRMVERITVSNSETLLVRIRDTGDEIEVRIG